MKTKILYASTALFFLFSALLGCSEEPTENPELNVFSDGDSDSDSDGDGDGEVDPCDEVVCATGEVCVEGRCEQAVDEGFGCAEPFDMGTLSGDGVLSWEADPVGQPNLFNTTCSADDRSAQAIFAFEVATPMRLTARVDFSEQVLVKELRKGACSSPGAVEWCTINPQQWYAEPGEQYFLIVEANEGGETETGSGNFSYFALEIETEELACTPPGSWSCDGDTLVQCFAGQEERRFDCPGGCGGSACFGDTCESAIEISGSQTVSANLTLFNNDFDFANHAECTSSGSGVATSGQDLVFLLRDVSAGQSLTINAPDSSFAIAVLESCNYAQPGCLAGDDEQGSLVWEAPAAGDYFVIINRLRSTSSSEPVAFEFQLQ